MNPLRASGDAVKVNDVVCDELIEKSLVKWYAVCLPSRNNSWHTRFTFSSSVYRLQQRSRVIPCNSTTMVKRDSFSIFQMSQMYPGNPRSRGNPPTWRSGDVSGCFQANEAWFYSRHPALVFTIVLSAGKRSVIASPESLLILLQNLRFNIWGCVSKVSPEMLWYCIQSYVAEKERFTKGILSVPNSVYRNRKHPCSRMQTRKNTYSKVVKDIMESTFAAPAGLTECLSMRHNADIPRTPVHPLSSFLFNGRLLCRNCLNTQAQIDTKAWFNFHDIHEHVSGSVFSSVFAFWEKRPLQHILLGMLANSCTQHPVSLPLAVYARIGRHILANSLWSIYTIEVAKPVFTTYLAEAVGLKQWRLFFELQRRKQNSIVHSKLAQETILQELHTFGRSYHIGHDVSTRRFGKYSITLVHDHAIEAKSLPTSILYAFHARVYANGPRGGDRKPPPIFNIYEGAYLRVMRFIASKAAGSFRIRLIFTTASYCPQSPRIAAVNADAISSAILPGSSSLAVFQSEYLTWGKLESVLKSPGLLNLDLYGSISQSMGAHPNSYTTSGCFAELYHIYQDALTVKTTCERESELCALFSKRLAVADLGPEHVVQSTIPEELEIAKAERAFLSEGPFGTRRQPVFPVHQSWGNRDPVFPIRKSPELAGIGTAAPCLGDH